MSFRRLIYLSALFPALLFLGGCSGNWGWYVVNPSTPAGQRNLMFLLDGLYYTIALSVTAILISIILGRSVCRFTGLTDCWSTRLWSTTKTCHRRLTHSRKDTR